MMETQQRTIGLLILIMAAVALFVAGITIILLYQEAYQQKRNGLMESVQTRVALIEAVTQFDPRYSKPTYPQGHTGATIGQVAEAFRQYRVLNDGEEWAIGEKQGDNIHFLLVANKQGLRDNIGSIAFSGVRGAAMHLALQGQRGIGELLDYQEKKVLVAYAPLPTLKMGLVLKIDLAKMRAPFVRAAWLAAGIGAFAIGLGTLLFMRVGQSITRRLQRSEQRLSTLLNTTPVGVYETDADGNCIYVNPRWCEITGISAEEVKGEGWSRALHPDDLAQVRNAWSQAVENGTTFKSEYRFLRADHAPTWVFGQAYLKHEKGEVSGHVGTITDITERKHFETALKELNETLEQRVATRTEELVEERNFISTILEIVGALVVVMDSSGRILRFNKACEKATGFSFDEVKGRSLWEMRIIPEEQVAVVQQVFSQLEGQQVFFQLNGNHQPSTYENEWLTKTGERRLIAWSNATLRDRDGTKLVIGTGIDITDRKQTEIALIRAKEIAETANHAKSEFLSRMSHELRTPLNAILGFSQLLESDTDHPLAADQLGDVQEILKAGYHLLNLVNEVLDLARIESGNMRCNLAPLLLVDMVKNSMHVIVKQAQQQNITIISQLAACSEAFVMADSTRLHQVLINLLSNAVKYNRPDGSIVLACEDFDSSIRLSITDTGKGIDPSKLSALFVPFERLGAEFTEVNGTGIGLALSMQLMELMGGSIGATSTPGQGSTFWIELPKAPQPIQDEAAAAAATQESPADIGKIKILYVEDNPANLKLVNVILSRFSDFALFPAQNAESGFELVKQHKPDVILMDINLPGLNGYQALDWLRANEETRTVPVIAVTADAMPYDVERGMNAGFDAYVTKPIDMNLLLAAIISALKPKG
jgi:PAS domain S-box-containing protein